MRDLMKRHEAFVRGELATASADSDWRALARCHRRQVLDMQHERLVHLLVTLFFGLCALVVFLFFVQHPDRVAAGVLLLLLIALLVPYVVHYFALENGVQRWYALADEIERRAGGVVARHDEGAIAPRPR
ncbi:MAG TPA: hypothetical protein PLE61_11225 [Vicinamibacterales bacterium]|nr:hypothetical protein [Vicinamibacterales bacterium]HPW21371.1 hypothetical protein [Vicinamibacterales bacterium]